MARPRAASAGRSSAAELASRDYVDSEDKKEMTLENLIARAKERARNGDNEGAMSLANELVEEYPNQMNVWSFRGYLHRCNNQYIEAVADLTRAIDINAKELKGAATDLAGLIAIDLYFNRGADNFALGDARLAVEDFSSGLDLSDRYHSDDYRETLHFWRAEALLRLGKKSEAMSDLDHVGDNFQFWTYKLRTKADLLADCLGAG